MVTNPLAGVMVIGLSSVICPKQCQWLNTSVLNEISLNAKRLHGYTTGLMTMYSPVCHCGIQYKMTKSKQSKKNAKNNSKRRPNKKPNPRPEPKVDGLALQFMRSLGTMGGSLLGGPAGAIIGGKALSDVGRWLGMGDYKVTSNTLVGNNAIPMMHNKQQSIVVRHKEYICDIISSGTANTFNVGTSVTLNPGLQASFPWLANVAQNFQEYTWRGLIFHYVSTSADAIASSTNTALGDVIIATQYRSTAAAFGDKPTMLNEYFTSNGKPSESFCHPIECDPRENPYNVQYVRAGAVLSGEDAKTYDLGVTSIATAGIQGTSNVCGEIWASYEVELRKPVAFGLDAQGQLSMSFNAGTPTAANFFAGTQTYYYNTLGIALPATGGLVTVPAGVGGNLFVNFIFAGVTTYVAPSAGTFVNCAVQPIYTSTNSLSAGGSAGNGNGGSFAFLLKIANPELQTQFTMSGGTFTGQSSTYLQIMNVNLNWP